MQDTIIQTIVPEQMRGRVYGAISDYGALFEGILSDNTVILFAGSTLPLADTCFSFLTSN